MRDQVIERHRRDEAMQALADQLVDNVAAFVGAAPRHGVRRTWRMARRREI
ncbi:hypothetical protein [Burkholderia sp. BCC0405]|uniref:hypothetical protein n=1 Tax=Burkholderia sp. BCC0405 TaxID=2676298 RepID=UPI00158EAEAA|nr:hypothetical protein [Burkholderia sp. BCC0405]